MASMERNAEALESFEAVLRLKPDYGPAHAARIEALYRMGRYEEAWRAVLDARAVHVEVDRGLVARVAARQGR